jgi:hypothetical protein
MKYSKVTVEKIPEIPLKAGSPRYPLGMRIKGGLVKGLLIALAITLIPAAAISAQKVTPGSKCKVQKQKVVYLDKSYTCIKSGKKLIWNKGSVTVKTEVAPTTQSNQTPPPTPKVPLPVEGTSCSKIGEKVSDNNGFMKCIWGGGPTNDFLKNVKWRYYTVSKVSSSKSNNYKTTPIQNATCANSGDTFDIPGGILECRWISGGKLQWIKINTIKSTFLNAKSPVSIDICKLQNSASSVATGGYGIVGFPLVNSNKHQMNLKGTNEVLIVPIDFPDFPGGSEVLAQLEYDK